MRGFSKSLRALIVLPQKCNAPVMINSKGSGLRVGHLLLVPVCLPTHDTQDLVTVLTPNIRMFVCIYITSQNVLMCGIVR